MNNKRWSVFSRVWTEYGDYYYYQFILLWQKNVVHNYNMYMTNWGQKKTILQILQIKKKNYKILKYYKE